MGSAPTQRGQNKAGFTVCVRRTPMPLRENIPITQQRAMLMKVSYGSFIYCGSYLTKPVSLRRLGVSCRSPPVSFPACHPSETKGANYERQKFFQIDPENRLTRPLVNE